MILDDAEIEAIYKEGRGMMEFARKVEEAALKKLLSRVPIRSMVQEGPDS